MLWGEPYDVTGLFYLGRALFWAARLAQIKIIIDDPAGQGIVINMTVKDLFAAERVLGRYGDWPTGLANQVGQFLCHPFRLSGPYIPAI